jgi:hypothetical protein
VGWAVGRKCRKMKRVKKGIQDVWKMKGYESKLA